MWAGYIKCRFFLFSKFILNIFCLNARHYCVFRTQLLRVLNRTLGQDEFPSTGDMALMEPSPLFSSFCFLQVLPLLGSIRSKEAGGCPHVSIGINIRGAQLLLSPSLSTSVRHSTQRSPQTLGNSRQQSAWSQDRICQFIYQLRKKKGTEL